MGNHKRPRMHDMRTLLVARRGELLRHARYYDEKLAEKRVTYYFNSKGVPKRRTIYFYKRNFMHLCGVSRYITGWEGFYDDCISNRLKPTKAKTIKPEYVDAKLDALAYLPKLLEEDFVGFSDGTVVHRSTNYGELVRTKEDLIALGTIEDRTTGNQVPISLINLDVSDDGMRVATSNWCKVYNIEVDDIKSDDTNTYQEERELEEKMRKKAEEAMRINRRNQIERAKKNKKGNKSNARAKGRKPRGTKTVKDNKDRKKGV